MYTIYHRDQWNTCPHIIDANLDQFWLLEVQGLGIGCLNRTNVIHELYGSSLNL